MLHEVEWKTILGSSGNIALTKGTGNLSSIPKRVKLNVVKMLREVESNKRVKLNVVKMRCEVESKALLGSSGNIALTTGTGNLSSIPKRVKLNVVEILREVESKAILGSSGNIALTTGTRNLFTAAIGHRRVGLVVWAPA